VLFQLCGQMSGLFSAAAQQLGHSVGTMRITQWPERSTRLDWGTANFKKLPSVAEILKIFRLKRWWLHEQKRITRKATGRSRQLSSAGVAYLSISRSSRDCERHVGAVYTQVGSAIEISRRHRTSDTQTIIRGRTDWPPPPPHKLASLSPPVCQSPGSGDISCTGTSVGKLPPCKQAWCATRRQYTTWHDCGHLAGNPMTVVFNQGFMPDAEAVTGVTIVTSPQERKKYITKNITSRANIALKCLFWKMHIFVILFSGSQSLPLLRPLQPPEFKAYFSVQLMLTCAVGNWKCAVATGNLCSCN